MNTIEPDSFVGGVFRFVGGVFRFVGGVFRFVGGIFQFEFLQQNTLKQDLFIKKKNSRLSPTRPIHRLFLFFY